MEMPGGSRLGQPGRTAKSQAVTCRPSQAASNHVVNDTPAASMPKTRLPVLCKVLARSAPKGTGSSTCHLSPMRSGASTTGSQERGQVMLQVGGQSPFSDISQVAISCVGQRQPVEIRYESTTLLGRREGGPTRYRPMTLRLQAPTGRREQRGINLLAVEVGM